MNCKKKDRNFQRLNMARKYVDEGKIVRKIWNSIGWITFQSNIFILSANYRLWLGFLFTLGGFPLELGFCYPFFQWISLEGTSCRSTYRFHPPVKHWNICLCFWWNIPSNLYLRCDLIIQVGVDDTSHTLKTLRHSPDGDCLKKPSFKQRLSMDMWYDRLNTSWG